MKKTASASAHRNRAVDQLYYICSTLSTLQVEARISILNGISRSVTHPRCPRSCRRCPSSSTGTRPPPRRRLEWKREGDTHTYWLVWHSRTTSSTVALSVPDSDQTACFVKLEKSKYSFLLKHVFLGSRLQHSSYMRDP